MFSEKFSVFEKPPVKLLERISGHTEKLLLSFHEFGAAHSRMAERSGVHSIYFSDPFQSWGHFDVNPKLYPGGKKEFCQMMEHARAHGVNVGFHTLSNFIHGHDPYVSPVPHEELLAFDPTPLASDISDDDAEIPLSEKLNYGVYTTVRAARIGDEIVRFAQWDEEKHALTGCQRGYFGTKACSHKAGETVTRLADHGYGTLFPTIKLQGELADHVGTLIRDAGIRRMSFDGVEGCFYTGRGEYGASEDIRAKMRAEGSDWHLEKTQDKWILSELAIRQYDLGYRDREDRSASETGTTSWISEEEAAEYPNAVVHQSLVVIDRSSTDKRMKDITEPLNCRIRVGNKTNHGKLHDLAFHAGWHGHKKFLSFHVDANAGDYLIYHGGTKLYHCDPDFNLLEVCEGDGNELIVNGSSIYGYTLHYSTVGDDMEIVLTHIRTYQTYEFPIK